MAISNHLGWRRKFLPLPTSLLRRRTQSAVRKLEAYLGFMTPEHHQVRNFIVLELPRRDTPLPPEEIAARLDLPPARVAAILDDLASHMFFVARDAAGAVIWAYPVTVEETPHRVSFASGEQTFAA
ncbi:MAG: hypothetical protein KQJ78_18370 [Deltaproteobacteria bacterium]|nr:hypothetical protein [Deltaproteobacteria bacterium]